MLFSQRVETQIGETQEKSEKQRAEVCTHLQTRIVGVGVYQSNGVMPVTYTVF